MNDPIPAADIDTSEWLTWDDYLKAPSGNPGVLLPPRAPEIIRAAEQAGIPVEEYGKLDPSDQQALRTDTLNRVADRLGDMAKELIRLAEEVRNNA